MRQSSPYTLSLGSSYASLHPPLPIQPLHDLDVTSTPAQFLIMLPVSPTVALGFLQQLFAGKPGRAVPTLRGTRVSKRLLHG